MPLGRGPHAAGWALVPALWLALSTVGFCRQAVAEAEGPESFYVFTGFGYSQVPAEGVEWLVRPLELGRSVPIATVNTADGGELQSRVLQGLRLSAVALPEGVKVAALSATLSYPGGGLGGSSSLGASTLVLPAGAVDPVPSRINMVLHARLEAAPDAAELDLEGPIQWRLELGSEETGRLDMLSDVVSRLAVSLHAPAAFAATASGQLDSKATPLSGPPAPSPRGGGKLPAAAMAGGRLGGDFVVLAVLAINGADNDEAADDILDGGAFAPFTGEVSAPGPATVARSVDGGRTWDVGALRIAGRAGTWQVPIDAPALLFDGRTGAFRLLCQIPAPLRGAGAEGAAPALVVLSSADGGRTWSTPEPLQIPRIGVDAAGREVDLSQRTIVSSGGRGIAASGGEWLWPLEIRGPGTSRRPVLLRESRRGGTSFITLGPRGRSAASYAELGDGAVLVSAASLRQASRELRLWREIDGAWRAPVRPPEPLLPCAGGAAALMHVGRELTSAMDGRLISANAAVPRKPPLRMSVRGSNDGGQRWPAHREVVLDDGRAVGGPGLAMADVDSVGVMYRASSGSVVFQSVPIEELVDPVAGVGSVTGGR